MSLRRLLDSVETFLINQSKRICGETKSNCTPSLKNAYYYLLFACEVFVVRSRRDMLCLSKKSKNYTYPEDDEENGEHNT